MKTIKFTVEKTQEGYTAFSEIPGKGIAGTTGTTIAELKKNALEAYNALLSNFNIKPISIDQIQLVCDLGQFFDYYKVINLSAFAERIGINRALLAQYKNGEKTASVNQSQKILKGIKELGRELYEADFI